MRDRKLEVFNFLKSFRDDRGECTPSIQQIMNGLKISTSCVRKHLSQLEREGVIEREQRWMEYENPDYSEWPPKRVRVSNLYRLVGTPGTNAGLRRSRIM